jgi:hypothetical protein
MVETSALGTSFIGVPNSRPKLRVHVSSGRLLVKLRVEVITKLLAQVRKGVFSLLPQLLPSSGVGAGGSQGVQCEELEGGGQRNWTLLMLRSSSKRSSAMVGLEGLGRATALSDEPGPNQPFGHQQPVDTGETKSAKLQYSALLQLANQCADGKAGLLQTQLDDRLGCLWRDRFGQPLSRRLWRSSAPKPCARHS